MPGPLIRGQARSTKASLRPSSSRKGANLPGFLIRAIIGFSGIREYPDLLRRLSDVVADRGYSLVALGSDLGLGDSSSRSLPWLVGGLALLVAAFAARGYDGDRRSFAITVLVSILLTPIVWLHYFALVYAPIAIWRRSLSAAWLLPLLLWLTPGQETQGDAWRVVLALVVGASAVVVAVVPRRGSRKASLVG